jgi:hypothetical protein
MDNFTSIGFEFENSFIGQHTDKGPGKNFIILFDIVSTQPRFAAANLLYV